MRFSSSTNSSSRPRHCAERMNRSLRVSMNGVRSIGNSWIGGIARQITGACGAQSTRPGGRRGQNCTDLQVSGDQMPRALAIQRTKSGESTGISAVTASPYYFKSPGNARHNQSSPMIDADAQVQKLLRQQAAIARFGSFALRERDLMKILTEAARHCAEGLSVPFSKVCQYRAEQNDLLIVAGYGWHDGVIGNVVSRADMSSPQGRAFTTGEPQICDDVRKDAGFDLPPFYAAHGIVSTVDVIIKGSDAQPYGILEIDNDKQHDYDLHDINFLTGFANVCLLYTSPSPRDGLLSRMPSSA